MGGVVVGAEVVGGDVVSAGVVGGDVVSAGVEGGGVDDGGVVAVRGGKRRKRESNDAGWLIFIMLS